MIIYLIFTIIQYPLNFFLNIVTYIVGLFIQRDMDIFLFGCSSGDRFSGNIRNMFLYLSQNQKQYKLKKVVFVTRSRELCKTLNEMGYDAFLMHSISSFYYHFKAGRHICNGNISGGFADGHYGSSDLMSFFSLGARHYYLNHHIGTGISNLMLERHNLSGFKRLLVDSYRFTLSINWLRHLVIMPGGWDNMTFCVSCHESLIQEQEFWVHFPIRFVVTCFPELLNSPDHLPNEKKLLNQLPKNQIRVLYCPAFRTVDTGYINPLMDNSFVHFLEKEGFIWIEKLMNDNCVNMTAKRECYNNLSILRLPGSFDLNILADIIDILVTDYSSARMKAIIRKKPVIYYVPDYDNYLTLDKGIHSHMKKSISNNRSNTVSELCNQLMEAKDTERYFSSERVSHYEQELKSQVDIIPSDYSYEQIVHDVFLISPKQ